MKTQKYINNWANDVFGKPISHIQIASRANEEMAELLNSLSLNDNNEKAEEECADVVICLYRLAEEMGFDLNGAVNKKMTINIKREWHTDNNGIGYHKQIISEPK
jgi:NTP pyrophosphatase (non-canonical NTP hydrolase)